MDILYIIIISLFSWSLGEFILSKFKAIDLTAVEKFVFGIGMGYGVVAYTVFVLGQFNALYSWVLIPVVLVVCLLLHRRIIRCAAKVFSFLRKIRISELAMFEKTLLLLLLSAAVFSLIGALTPPVGNDALAYHLEHPKVFVETHSVNQIPFSRESLWPYLVEMLFTFGLILKSPVLAKLFHYAFGVLSTMAVFCFGQRFLGKKTGLIAAALFYLSPGIFMQASYAYIELALCFYVFCSLYLFLLWYKEKCSQYLMVSGALMGLAFSVKILAGIGLIPLGILLVFVLIKDRASVKRSIGALAAFMIPVALVGFMWYLRSYLLTGNPVYPFMHTIFGSGWKGYDLVDYVNQVSVGHVDGIAGFIRLPWDLVMNIGSFGAGEQIGFLFLALMPCLFFVDWKNSINKIMFFFTIVFTAVWFFKVEPAIRYYFAAFPVIFLIYSSGLDNLLYKRKFNFLKWIICGGLCFNLMLAGYYNMGAIKLLTGRVSEEQFLLDNERTYKMAKWANEQIDDNSAVILVNEPRMYYFRMPRFNYTAIFSDGSDVPAVFDEIRKNHENVYIVVNNEDSSDKFIKSLIYKKQPLFSSSSSEDEKPYKYSIYEI